MRGDSLPKRAYAVMLDDTLALTDERLPVFWRRATAKAWADEFFYQGPPKARIVQVEILEVTKKK